VRLPGSGGGNDVGSLCWQTIAIMRHDTRRFVPTVDFITTPGYLTGPGAREEAGLPPGTGPIHVVSTLALMGFDAATKRMTLLATHPGVTVDHVIANTGFELLMGEPVDLNDPPTREELRILRDEVDRDRLYI
jgi:glutaconate CoA-transferase subunit B